MMTLNILHPQNGKYRLFHYGLISTKMGPTIHYRSKMEGPIKLARVVLADTTFHSSIFFKIFAYLVSFYFRISYTF